MLNRSPLIDFVFYIRLLNAALLVRVHGSGGEFLYFDNPFRGERISPQ